MFQELLTLVNSAIEMENNVKTRFNEQKTALSLDIKSKIEDESRRMTESVSLQDYSPIKHLNEMTELTERFKKMNTIEQQELELLNGSVKESLINSMNLNVPKEIYKIMGYNGVDDLWICRVWFTLIPILEYDCIPGDPIRVEWIQISDEFDEESPPWTKSIRNGPGLDNLMVPHMENEYLTIESNKLYPINHWGEDSNQKLWWLNWIANNRPC